MEKYFNKKNIVTGFAVLLGFAVFVLMFVPLIEIKATEINNGEKHLYSGVQLAFGYTSPAGISIFKFSIWNFLAFILVIAGVIFSTLLFFEKLKKCSGIIAAACYLVATVLIFFMPNFIIFSKRSAMLAISRLCALTYSLMLFVAFVLCIVKISKFSKSD